MDDIVARLRREGENAMRKHLSMGMHGLCAEAAHEIERCREIAYDEELKSKAMADEVRRLQRALTLSVPKAAAMIGALKEIANYCGANNDDAEPCREIARNVLRANGQ